MTSALPKMTYASIKILTDFFNYFTEISNYSLFVVKTFLVNPLF